MTLIKRLMRWPVISKEKIGFEATHQFDTSSVAEKLHTNIGEGVSCGIFER